ncbi:MAG: hypothetical protein K0S46_2699 [Moraxellaceae bacterium]|jgi:hypothetical protein|nr:hypothetical protein [Moraxellaceae bacterium]
MEPKNVSKLSIRRHVVEAFLNSVPPTLRSEVLSNDEFRSEIGVIYGRVIEIGGKEISIDDFLKSLRDLCNGNSVVCCLDVLGNAVPVKASLTSDGDAIVEIEGSRCRIKGAQVLSSNMSLRLSALEGLCVDNYLSSSVQKKWRARGECGEFSNDEFAEFQKDIDCSLKAVLDGFRSLLDSGTFLKKSPILPDFLELYLAFLADIPSECSGLTDFAEHGLKLRKLELLEQDIKKGMEIIGPTSLLYDEGVVEKIVEVAGSKLPEIISTLSERLADPFSQVLLFDVCVSAKNQFPELVDVGRRIIEVIFAEGEETSLFDYSISLTIALSGVSQSKSLRAMPLYYRRLAAWGLAGFITRILGDYSFNRVSLSEWLNRNFRLNYVYCALMERAECIYWRPEWTTIEVLRALVLRRINRATARLPDSDLPQQWREAVDELVGAPKGFDAVCHYLPGPIDEFLSVDAPLVGISEDAETALLEADESSSESLLARIGQYAYTATMSTALIDRFIELSGNFSKNIRDIKDRNLAISSLHAMSHVAGILRNRDLSLMAVIAARSFNELSAGEEWILEIFIILDSSAAIAEFDDRAKFISESFTRLSFSNLSKVNAQNCLNVFTALSKSEPRLAPYLSRAIAALRVVARK